MAAMAHLSCIIRCPSFQHNCSMLSPQIPIYRNSTTSLHTTFRILHKRTSIFIVRSAANDPSSPEISSTAKIRSEVLSPFRTVRMFFYLAFIASSALGGLIATTQLIAALANSSRAAEVPEILKGLGIDIGAFSIFAFLYSRENSAKNAQLARLSREERLSNLKLQVDQKKVISVSSLRGFARLVILAGPASFITESFRLSEPFTESLLERGVLVVPFVMDGDVPRFEFEESEEMKELTTKRKRLWQLVPVSVSQWSKWLDEQKKLAKVPLESPVSENALVMHI
ncbi:protein LOW PSII ACCUMULATION 1, chloroplastic isoform X2 [Macadamia integrifolia]|uniref:protein LOW PSII ACCUMULATION 1, chloroplastic isoform X2 n=1 Tax=Macadamia integrifolia TaxID=60698 RepID=UPI001C4F02E2|nr:protein LOW PSII ACCUMULATION 1, chloroplastic isoform X2 [Macadamia integrifolia]